MNEGSQIVTKRGIETVIVLSMNDYRKLIKPRTNLVDFFQKSPLHGIKLDIDRSKEPSQNLPEQNQIKKLLPGLVLKEK